MVYTKHTNGHSSLFCPYGIFYTLRCEPTRQFHNGNASWFGGGSNADGIADMVKMTMGDQHNVNMVDLFEVIRTSRVTLCPGIDQNNLPLCGCDLECRVSKPGDLDTLHVHGVTRHVLFLLEENR